MRIPRQPSANPRDGARPLFVTADPVLAEAVCRVAADADVGLDIVDSATSVRGRWRSAPVVLVGDDLAAELARAALPRRDGVVQEVILATNFTAEGEATAHVIGEALKAKGLKVTRLARGVPAGSELEYVDLGTIAHALVDRR